MKLHLPALLTLPLVAAACVGTTKSENPLAPSIAGPIAGVGISEPAVMAPPVDAMIDTRSQPITFRVGNASTNGVRPLKYRFEIATDPSFANPVFIKADVDQDASGTTSMTLPGPLSPERKYYWHARAEDGANSGAYGSTSAFSVFTPVIFGAPSLLSPVGGATTSTKQPTFVIGNANRSGPVTAVYYVVEVATTGGFDSIINTWQLPESGGQTQLTAPVSLPTGLLYWRAKAFDLGHTGPYSGVESFRVPATTGGGGGGGGTQNPQGSMIDTLNAVRAEFPTNWTHEDRGRFLNKVAWIRAQMGEPFGMLRKPSGNNCPTPQGVAISCDYLVYQTTLNGYDVLSDETTPVWSGLDHPTDNFASDPSRFLAPVAP
jgi:hypothetical protein